MISFNLTNLLQEYQPTEATKDSDEGLKQREPGQKLCNILAVGTDKLTSTQQSAVKEFHNKFSESNPHDIVVKVVNGLVTNLLISDLHKDLQATIDAHRDISTTKSLSGKELQNAAVYAARRLCDAASEDAPLNYSDLLQFTKVIAGFGYELLGKSEQEKVVQALNVIMKKSDSADESVSKLHDVARTVVKKHEAKHLPPALVRQFEMCKAFHGQAINDGINTIQKELLKTGKVDQTLLKFAGDYCMDHLNQGQYLIRLSSTVSNIDTGKIKFFVATISYKPGYWDMIHTRVTCIDSSKGGPWVRGEPPFMKGKKLPKYNSIGDLVKAILKNYIPRNPLSPNKQNKYISKYIK